MAEATDLLPLEWLGRLGPALVARRPAVDFWRRYYDGDQDLPTGPNQAKAAYRRFQKKARTNLCLLCAESMVHRTQAIGFRDTTSKDDAVWRLWQGARLDARQFALWRKAYSRSAAYMIIGVDPRNSSKPLVTIEGPENVIVEVDPADHSRRLAALRLWHDSIAKRWMATLYLRGLTDDAPGTRYHWQSVTQVKKVIGRTINFQPSAWEERADPGRTLPRVPVIPFLNGDEGEPARAEFDVGIDVQDRLNLTLLNRLTAERYGAFRQAALMNYELEEDPVTGLPISPLNPGVDQLMVVPPPEPGNPAPSLISLPQTDTSQMLRGVEADMRAFAAVTLTPVYYLPGDLVNIGADSVAALDAGHIAKVKQRMTLWGEGLEEAAQYMSDVAGLGRDLSSSEIVWAKPENFQPAAVADYFSKLVAGNIPVTMAAEEMGWSPQRIEQLRAEMTADALRASMAAALAAPAPPSVSTTQAVQPAQQQQPGIR